MSNVRASVITIGDELLIGQTIDTNSAWIAQHLNAIGIDVVRRVAVGDDAGAITNALDEELGKAEIVLVTGGLGPTADDITKPLLAKYFGSKLVLNETVLAHVKELFVKRNRPFLERNVKQAEIPDNCTVLHNKIGTAPGMWFEKDNKVIIAMPGVPFEMAGIMEDEVLPRLQRRFVSDAIVHVSIITSGEGESFIADKIQDLEEALPKHIKLAYLPGLGAVKLRLTGKGKDKEALTKELTLRRDEMAARLADFVVGLEDVPMEHILGRALAEKKLTLGLAESCTGGYIAHLITQVPGASQYFKGDIVCYLPEIKERILGVEHSTIEKYGVVSEETAIEMAKNTLKVLNCDYSLSVTGVLGPAGDDDEAPVGTVWMAVANKEQVRTKKFRFHYDRTRNKEMAVQMGMLMIWKFLNHKP